MMFPLWNWKKSTNFKIRWAKYSKMSKWQNGYSLHFHGSHPLKVLITLCNNESTHIIAEKSEIQASKVIPSNIQKSKATNWVAPPFLTPAIKWPLVECFSQKETGFHSKAFKTILSVKQIYYKIIVTRTLNICFKPNFNSFVIIWKLLIGLSKLIF